MKVVLIIIAFIAVITLASAVYIVDIREQVIVLQFGELVGKPITEPGLYFKTPFIQDVKRLEKRILEWDGEPTALYTGGGEESKERIEINTWGRWRIVDPLKFFTSLRTEERGQGVLDEKIQSAVQNVVASYSLYEILRNTNREYKYDSEELAKVERDKKINILKGRQDLLSEILKMASDGLVEKYGMALLEVQIKHINYVEATLPKIYKRMETERTRIADRYRSEGQKRAEEIEGEIEREKARIESEGYREATHIRGDADAKALKIYAEAYQKDPEFYAFWKTLQTYEKTFNKDTNLVLSSDDEYFQYLKGYLDKETSDIKK